MVYAPDNGRSRSTTAPALELGPAEIRGPAARNDYGPLAVALLVDIYLLLGSVSRNPRGLDDIWASLQTDARGPLAEIVARFDKSEPNSAIRRQFELFRHVVFDLQGAYYVAVPLDMPYHPHVERREALRNETRFLATLFARLEKDRVFARTWTPFIGRLKRRLAQQGSKFAGAQSFRVYKFRDTEWSELIFDALMGATWQTEAGPSDRREPELGRGFEHRPTRMNATATTPPRETPLKPEPRMTAESRPLGKSPLDPLDRPPPIRTRFAAPRYRYVRSAVFATDLFGPYARSAEAELTAALNDDAEATTGETDDTGDPMSALAPTDNDSPTHEQTSESAPPPAAEIRDETQNSDNLFVDLLGQVLTLSDEPIKFFPPPLPQPDAASPLPSLECAISDLELLKSSESLDAASCENGSDEIATADTRRAQRVGKHTE